MTDAPSATHSPRGIALLGAALALLPLAGALALACALAIHECGLAVDDAYISFRYADNLVHGHGLRWNTDMAPSEGYTNLLHVLLVAAASALGLPFELGAALVSCAALCGTALVLLLAVRAHAALLPAAAVPALLFVSDLRVQSHAARGLETMLFLFLVTSSVASLAHVVRSEARSRRALALAVLGTVLAFLCRPDGVLACGVAWLATLALLWRRKAARRRALMGLLAVIGAGAAYAAWKLWYFGYLLPNSFYMKATAGGFVGGEETLAFLREYRPMFVALGVLALAAVLVRWRTRASPRPFAIPVELVVALPLLAAWLAYTAKILHEIGFDHRFSYPIVPVAWLAVAATGTALLARIRGPRWQLLVATLALGITAFTQLDDARRRYWDLLAAAPADPYSGAFLRLGHAIRDSGLADRVTLMCSHAGATPFASRVRHIDLGGLTDDMLCMRTPFEERLRYFGALKIDLMTAPLFPASPGATAFENEPRAASRYVREWYFGLPPDADAGWRLDSSKQSLAQRAEQAFLEMARLRDTCTLVGEMNTQRERWRLFVYVVKISPWHDELVRALSARVDVPVDRIDWDGWPR